MSSAAPYLNTRLIVALARCLLTVCMVTGSAEAQTISARIINGEPIPTKGSPIVAVLQRVTEKQTALCSGSVIAPRAVLTAWHCVTKKASNMRVFAGRRIMQVRRVSTHPGAGIDPTTGLAVNDLAVLHLKRRANAPTIPILTSKPVAAGDPVTLVGYGVDQSGQAGVLRAGSADIGQVAAPYFVTIFNGAESNSCVGDSGGPAVLSYQSAEGATVTGIVGTVSEGTTTSCETGDITFYIDLQRPEALDYIRSEVPTVTVD